MLHQMSPILDESCFSVGRLEENILKNRNPDILPLDMNRAYLSTPVKGSNEYINAVFVPVSLYINLCNVLTKKSFEDL